MAQSRLELIAGPIPLPTVSLYFGKMSISSCVHHLVLCRKTTWP